MIAEIDAKGAEDKHPDERQDTPLQVKNQGTKASSAIRWQASSVPA